MELLKSKTNSFYDEFLQQENELLETFFNFKMSELRKKKEKVKKYL